MRPAISARGRDGAGAGRGCDPGRRSGVIGVAAINPESAAVAPVIAAARAQVRQRSGAAGRRAVGHGRRRGGSVGRRRARPEGRRLLRRRPAHDRRHRARRRRAITGARGRAGSVAWLALNPVEREDYRKIGCLEAEVAAAGHRPPPRLAHQGGRSIARAGRRQGRLLRDHRRARARPPRATATASRFRWCATPPSTSAWPRRTSSPSPIRRCWCSAASWPSAADLLLEPVRTEIARRLPKPMMDALRDRDRHARRRRRRDRRGAPRHRGAP